MGCGCGGGRGGLGVVPARGRVAAPRVRVGLLEWSLSSGGTHPRRRPETPAARRDEHADNGTHGSKFIDVAQAHVGHPPTPCPTAYLLAASPS